VLLVPDISMAQRCPLKAGRRMISELEAKACRHAFTVRERAVPLGRALGPLVAWLALFLFLTVGGLVFR
jgi:hypothetical protein